MSDDKPKPPLPDEADWESALDAWDTLGESVAPPPVAPLPVAPSPSAPSPSAPPQLPSHTSTVRGMPIARRPLYQAPAAASSTIPPPMNDAALASLHAFSEDDDERTIVGRISPELLADAGETRNPSTGSGLGQVFRRNVPRAPAPQDAPAVPAKTPSSPGTAASGDALMDLLFEEPGALLPDDEPSVVTSAPRISPNDAGISEDERKRSEDHESVVAEGELFDPFAPSLPVAASPSGKLCVVGTPSNPAAVSTSAKRSIALASRYS